MPNRASVAGAFEILARVGDRLSPREPTMPYRARVYFELDLDHSTMKAFWQGAEIEPYDWRAQQPSTQNLR